MKKAIRVSRVEHQIEDERLSKLEGTVVFSDLASFEGNSSPTLILKLKCPNAGIVLSNDETVVWIRGSHRINEGEKIRIHYSSSSTPIVAEAYEIISKDGSVRYRYHHSPFKFIDDTTN